MTSALAASPFGARLRLLRASNLFSPIADVLSGACVAAAAGFAAEPARIAWAAAASSAIYHSGMALNDLADRVDDARTRPERPLPSRAVSPREALGWGVVLTAASVAASVVAGNWRVMAPLAAIVWIYDLALRRGTWLGPLFLGSARGLNVFAGMQAAGVTWSALIPTDTTPYPPFWFVALGYGTAIVGLSIFALGEDLPWSLARAFLAALFALGGLSLAFAALPAGGSGAIPKEAVLAIAWLPLLEPLSIVLGPPRPWGPERVGAVVGASLRGTLVFHALIGAATGVPALSLFCGIGYVLARILARWIPPN